ncbi:MAG TPA: hypothetical protein VFQ41_19005 [Candidatus Angelobacter sp.]|nr:hypothetical protein [Candidatus Angelobacter sp.]
MLALSQTVSANVSRYAYRSIALPLCSSVSPPQCSDAMTDFSPDSESPSDSTPFRPALGPMAWQVETLSGAWFYDCYRMDSPRFPMTIMGLKDLDRDGFQTLFGGDNSKKRS